MATSTRTSNPLRAKALSYLRDGRVNVRFVGRDDVARLVVDALVEPAASANGMSLLVGVRMLDGDWNCTERPGHGSCAHRLAVQMVTGWSQAGGRWSA